MKKKWDYDKSAEKMRPAIIIWVDIVVEIARELRVAKEHFDSQKGKVRKKADGSFVPTWADYCLDIGFPARLANTWLRKFEPRSHAGTIKAKTSKRGKV